MRGRTLPLRGTADERVMGRVQVGVFDFLFENNPNINLDATAVVDVGIGESLGGYQVGACLGARVTRRLEPKLE